MKNQKNLIYISIIVSFFALCIVAFLIILQPTTNKDNGNIDQDKFVEEYKQYSKKINHSFELDSTEFKVISFEYIIADIKTDLKIIISIKNRSSSKQVLTSDNFKLLSESKKISLPDTEPIILESNSSSLYLLRYNLPPKNVPYLAYFLNITKGNEKAIISISKSFRSEG